jgi:hypothetical protein
MINSSEFRMRLLNCHLAYASKKNSILQPPLNENPRWLYCGRHPAQVAVVAREGGTGVFFPNQFWRLPIHIFSLKNQILWMGLPSFYSCSIWAPNLIQIRIKRWPALALNPDQKMSTYISLLLQVCICMIRPGLVCPWLGWLAYNRFSGASAGFVCKTPRWRRLCFLLRRETRQINGRLI